MRISILFFLFLFLNLSNADAQVQLKMDKFGKKKSLDFHEGDEIVVRLKGETGYHKLYIKKLYPEANLISTQLGTIELGQIERLRVFKTRKLGKILKYQFWTFGAGWAFYSVIAALFLGEPWLWSTAVVLGVAFLIGWIFGFSLRHKTYKIGKKRKLRIMDISFGKPLQQS